jgi:hypothetical protein
LSRAKHPATSIERGRCFNCELRLKIDHAM